MSIYLDKIFSGGIGGKERVAALVSTFDLVIMVLILMYLLVFYLIIILLKLSGFNLMSLVAILILCFT